MAQYIYDKFKIANKIVLTNVEINVLSSMYMPLIGMDSYALYMFLLAFEGDDIYPFKKILDSLNIASIKILNQSFEKLEALNLIKTYLHETKGYAIELLHPLSKKEFLDNEALNQFLKTQIGESEFTKLTKTSESRLGGYKNISKKFGEVFQSSTATIEMALNKIIGPNIIIENPDFNYTLFKYLVDEALVPEDVLNDNKLKERIERIAFTYKLDEEEMRDTILKTISIDKNFEYATIARNASLMFQKKNNVAGPAIETIKEDSFVVNNLDANKQKVINMVESLSTADVLESLWNVKPSVSEIKMFDNLSLNTKLSIPVINILILFVNSSKKEIMHLNYYEKIAVSWARAGIKTVNDAINHINSNEIKAKPKTTRPKKVTQLPDWYEEYQTSLHQKPEEAPTVTLSNKKELLDLVKEMFD